MCVADGLTIHLAVDDNISVPIVAAVAAALLLR
jgi:dolichol kinase